MERNGSEGCSWTQPDSSAAYYSEITLEDDDDGQHDLVPYCPQEDLQFLPRLLRAHERCTSYLLGKVILELLQMCESDAREANVVRLS
jgi:hypothetical protein